MIAEAGHFALVLALCVAFAQGTLPLVGAHLRVTSWIAFSRPAAIAQFLLISLAFGALMHAYVTSDFSLLNVAENSHTAKPMLYKISGVWANHEGSMVLWVLTLSTFGAAVATFGTNLPPTLRARALAVQALISVGFIAFILFTSNPFVRLVPAPINGSGLNPLLQDPGLAFHPPFLYLGYVGLSMAFSFAMAALIEGRVDATWARWVRPWTLAAWIFLTAGITLGSWWAYYELGWGGWWYWDPVENASFMPWLVATALLHSSIVVEKRDTLKGWTIFLAIVAFAFSLLGTFLVRSGILTSVHTFASDPDRGVFILALLIIYIGGAFLLFAIRGPSLRGGGLFQPISREGGLVINNLMLTVAAAAILLGTLYPLILDFAGGGKISVGPPFFNAVFIPLMVPLIAVMAMGPLLPWKRGYMTGVTKRLQTAAAIAGAVLFSTWLLHDRGSALAGLGFALAAWLFGGTLTEVAERIYLFRAPVRESLRRLGGMPRSAWGMTLAHAGLAIVVAGITASSAWKVESVQSMRPGDTVTVAGYDFTFDGARRIPGPNYQAERGTFTVHRDGTFVVVIEPELRNFPVEQRQTTEAGIHSTFFGDIYAVIGMADPTGAFITRLYFNPLVAWMWGGVMIMVAGGLVSLTDRRHRVGAPSRNSGRVNAAASAKA